MKYRCTPCDHEFEVKKGTKPRCPRCLKIHDLEPVEAANGESRASGSKAKWIAAALFLIGFAVFLTLYFVHKDGPPPSPKVDPDGLKSILSKADLNQKDSVNPFFVTERVEKFARDAVDGKTGLDALRALTSTLIKWKNEKRFKPHHQREAKKSKPLTADGLVARLTENGHGTRVYEALSYELATTLLAAARSVDVDVKMAEILNFESEKTPADPAGRLGRFGVVYGDASAPEKLVVFDPYSGRQEASAKANLMVLSDMQAIAHYYGISSLSALQARDTQTARKLNEVAIELDPKHPYFRTGRGLIFAASAAPKEALAEFEKALKMRDDAVTRTNLAEILLLVDFTGKQAEASISAALSKMPDFGRAHAVQAMIHVIRGEFDQAEPELALADRLDPGSPNVAMFWAQYYAAQQLTEEAIEKAEQAVRLSNESITALMGLAGIYRATARFDEMRTTLDKALARSDSPTLAREIKQIFGYEQETEDATAESPDAGPGSGRFELKLGGGTKGLGGSQLKLGPEDNQAKSPTGQDLQLKLKLDAQQ